MIEKVKLQEKSIADYSELIDARLSKEIQELAQKLQGKKIVHVNATSKLGGGGVAEILHSLIPLMIDLGIDASWYTISPPPEFFEITNKIHNALQGSEAGLSKDEEKLYLKHSQEMAKEIETTDADLFIIHDPQPLLAATFSEKIKPAISRIHIDLSAPNKKVWDFLFPYFRPYEKVVLSIHDFINGNFDQGNITIFPPAIDPLSPKNVPSNLEDSKRIVESLGINTSKPIISQISRLDKFKDPIGVIKAFYIAKKSIPDLQLILLAKNIATDNPLSKGIYEEVRKYSDGDHDIFLFYDQELPYTNDTVVNAVQSASDIVIQKSVKEGFGLTVTEAMWKNKAVIAGRVGGIKIQIKDGFNGYLVSTVEHCAARIVEILKDPEIKESIEKNARYSVSKNFLITRLLRDHLKLYSQI